MADQNGNGSGSGGGTTVESILKVLLGQLEKISKAETVAGTPIVADKTTIIPVSKVTIGFAAGGSDAGGEVGSSTHRRGTISIGGTGGGISVEPVAFIVVTPDGKPQLLPMKSTINQVSQAINLLPEAISKLAALRSGEKPEKGAPQLETTERKKKPDHD